jgi:hypothetical protein
MLKRLIVVLVAVSFVVTSPALAVKKVPQQPKQQVASSSQESGQEKQAPKERSSKQEPQSPPDESRQPAPPPERPRVKETDRFIDEDSDGINDRLKKSPVVKKKKREAGPKKTETRKRPR